MLFGYQGCSEFDLLLYSGADYTLACDLVSRPSRLYGQYFILIGRKNFTVIVWFAILLLTRNAEIMDLDGFAGLRL